MLELTKEDLAKVARHFYELGQQSRPKKSDNLLEEEIEIYFQGWINDDEYGDALMPDYTGVNVDKCKDIARHFAELERKRTLDKVVERMKKNLTYTHPRKGVETCMVNIGVFLDAMGMGAENLKK